MEHRFKSDHWSAGFAVAAAACVLLRLVIWKFFPNAETIVKEDLSNLTIASVQLGLGMVYAVLAAGGKVKLRLTGFEWPLGIMASAASLSLAYTVDFSMSIRVWLPLVGSMVLFYILANTLTSTRRVKFFLYFILACALVTSIYGVQEFFYLSARQSQPGDSDIAQYNNSLYYILVNRRVTSFLGWPNSLAGYLCLILPFAGLSVLRVTALWLKGVLVLVFMTLVACLLVTFSFLGWLSFLLASLIMVPLVLRQLAPWMDRRLKAALIVLGIIFTGLFVLVILRKNFMASLLPRVDYYAQAWHLVMERLWTGYGYGTFGIAARPLVETQTALTNFVHNSYLQWWVECGVAGLAGVGALVIVFGVMVRRNLAALPVGEEGLVLIAVVWGLTAFFIDNLFSFTLVKPNIAVHGWAMLGVFAALGAQVHRKNVTAPASLFPVIAGGCTCLAALVLSVALSFALTYYYTGALAFRAGNVDAAGQAFVKGSLIDRWSSIYPAAAGDSAIRVYQASQKEYFLRLAETNYLEAVRREPLQYAPQLMLSRIYTAVGEHTKALNYAREAKRLSPFEYGRDVAIAAQNTPSSGK